MHYIIKSILKSKLDENDKKIKKIMEEDGSSIKKYDVLHDENPSHEKVLIYSEEKGYHIISPFKEFVLKDLGIEIKEEYMDTVTIDIENGKIIILPGKVSKQLMIFDRYKVEFYQKGQKLDVNNDGLIELENRNRYWKKMVHVFDLYDVEEISYFYPGGIWHTEIVTNDRIDSPGVFSIGSYDYDQFSIIVSIYTDKDRNIVISFNNDAGTRLHNIYDRLRRAGDKYIILANDAKEYLTVDEYVSSLIKVVESKYSNNSIQFKKILQNPAFKMKLEEKIKILKENDIDSYYDERVKNVRNDFIDDLAKAQEKYDKRVEEKRALEQLTIQNGGLISQKVLTKKKRKLASRNEGTY